jgi:hypothetical protein
MKPELECGITASFLDSGKLLMNAAHCAALIAGGGMLLSDRRLLFACSLICWPLVCYLGIRVAIDASLFRELANAPEEAVRALDEMLRVPRARTFSQRSRGALRLWKRLIAAVAIQFAILAVALTIS